MRTSVLAVKRTGITFAEFCVTVFTLMALNAVVLFPFVRMAAWAFRHVW